MERHVDHVSLDRDRTQIAVAAIHVSAHSTQRQAFATSALLQTLSRTDSGPAGHAVQARHQMPTGQHAMCAQLADSRHSESNARSVCRHEWWRRRQASATRVQQDKVQTPTGNINVVTYCYLLLIFIWSILLHIIITTIIIIIIISKYDYYDYDDDYYYYDSFFFIIIHIIIIIIIIIIIVNISIMITSMMIIIIIMNVVIINICINNMGVILIMFIISRNIDCIMFDILLIINIIITIIS